MVPFSYSGHQSLDTGYFTLLAPWCQGSSDPVVLLSDSAPSQTPFSFAAAPVGFGRRMRILSFGVVGQARSFFLSPCWHTAAALWEVLLTGGSAP